MKRMYVLMAAVVLAAMMAGVAQAAPFNVWFADSSGASIDELAFIEGTGFTVNVFASTEVASAGLGIAVKYENVKKVGTAWVKQDNKVAMATGDPAVDFVWGAGVSGLYASEFSKKEQNLSGGTSTVKSFGATLERGSLSDVAPFGAIKIATLSLKSTMTAGQTYDLSIFDAGSGDVKTTVLMGTDGAFYRASDTLRLRCNPIPEPGSLLALGSGLVGLAGFVIRRRK